MFAALAVPALGCCLDLAVELRNEIRCRVVTTGEGLCAVGRRPGRITDCGRGPAAFGGRCRPTKAQLAMVVLPRWRPDHHNVKVRHASSRQGGSTTAAITTRSRKWSSTASFQDRSDVA